MPQPSSNETAPCSLLGEGAKLKSNRLDALAPPAELNEIALELVDSLDAMLAYWDVNQVCVFANSAYFEWFGKTKREMVGITLAELLGPLYPKNRPYIDAAYAGRKQVFERAIRTPDGGVRPSLATYTPRIVEGKVQGIFVHVADVTPLKRLENELRVAKATAENLAIHDFLTGLPNRVLLLDRVTQALALARRTQRVVAVVTLDVDDFKAVNDTYGHVAGDQLLVELASRLTHSLRESETVTRMGGDEFLLLAPDMESEAEVEIMAARILERLREPVRLGGVTVSLTCSAGIAAFPRQATTPDALIASSDRALYVAKRLGKNRYVFEAP